MSLWGKIGRGLTGAATGFITSGGNPLGAVAGAASGLLSSGGKSSGTQTSTREVNLRDLSPEEQRIQSGAQAGILASQKEMSSKEIEESRKRSYDALYGHASDEINQGYATLNAKQTASSARRGASVSSAGLDREDQNKAYQSRELGRASQEATVGAEQLLLAERADRRAAGEAYSRQLDQIWRNRLASSSITTTGSAENTSPDTFWQSAAAGIGNAIVDEGSAFNKGGGIKGLFGGGGTSGPNTSGLARPGTTETNSWTGVQ